MSKKFYTDYVRHALRFYTRNLIKPAFKSDADKSNWLSCQSVLAGYGKTENSMLVAIYSGHDTLADEVYNTSKKFNTEQNLLWDMMKDVEHKIARRRGLI